MRACRLFLVAGLLFAICPAGAEPRIAPVADHAYRVDGQSFDKPKKQLAVSGFACAPARRDLCVLATDEDAEATFARVTDDAIAFPSDKIALSKTKSEADAEGVAVEGDVFYIVGSHAPKRATCALNSASRNVHRISVKDGAATVLHPAGDALWTVFQSLPELKPYARDDACLGTKAPPAGKTSGAIDIEGIAAIGGRLYLGLRGPSLGGKAVIVSVDAAGLFSGEAAKAKPALYPVDIGARRGFRDLTVWDGEILGLVGPDDDSDPAVDYAIVALDHLAAGGAPKPRPLATLDMSHAPLGQDKNGDPRPLKPEALAILSASGGLIRALVLSDSGLDGAPLVFEIPR